MQDHNKPKGIRGFLRDYGYYLVIGFCALAIGVSGYLLLRGGNEAEEPMLNVPVRIETEEETPQPRKQETVRPSEPTKPAMAEEPEAPEAPAEEEPAAETAAEEPKPRVVVSPVEGEVLTAHSVASLAYNETTRDWRTHTGIDFAADVGSTVAAAEDGTVTAIYSDDYLGTTVEILHPSGYTTVYSNLQEMPAVAVGQTVCAGDPVGCVGQTALLEVAAPPHLHFAVRTGAADVDPAEYLS